MAIIKSGQSTDQLLIDSTSKAAKVTPYDSGALEIMGTGNPISVNPSGTTAQPTAFPTLTKGTQGNGFSTQRLIDSGRSTIAAYKIGVAPGIGNTEGMVTFSLSRDTGSVTVANTFTPTSGKTFRITGIYVRGEEGAAAAGSVTVNFRINTAGSVTITSTPIIYQVRLTSLGTQWVWDQGLGQYVVLEIRGNGTLQWGVSIVGPGAESIMLLDINIFGYEY